MDSRPLSSEFKVPFVPWQLTSPAWPRSSSAARSRRPPWLTADDQRHCAAVWDELSPRKKDYLRALAEGLRRSGIAARLLVAVTTLDTQKDEIISLVT